MKMALRAFPVALLLSAADASNPMGTVIGLLDDLNAKIIKDGEAAQAAYVEYVEWCDEASKNTGYAIETAEKEIEKLNAKIGELSSDIDAATEKIDALAGSISKADKELEDATVIRAKEAKDFAASEAELMETVDTLGRAIGIIEKEMAKNPAAFAQMNTKDISAAVQALSVVLDAAAFPSNDQKKLMAFVQSQQTEQADDLDAGAPAASTYKSQSGGILDVLEDLKEKAEGQLSELRKAEVNTKHNFEMLKQSLEDQITVDTKDKGEETAARAAASESKATAEGDLKATGEELAASKKQLATAHSSCLTVAADHEASVNGRAEELAVLAKAKKILEETSSGAVSETYSFVQTGAMTRSRLAGSEVIVAVKKLAKSTHSSALAQLASRISTVIRFGASSGADPFGKVKGLIVDMIAKLEKEAKSDAMEKAYCDEQMAKTEAKKSELEEDIAKMTAKIDQSSAKSAELKEQVRELEAELAALAKEQAELDKIRQEENADFKQAKADLELGLSGVRKALKLLREYYGSAASMLQEEQPAKPVNFAKSSGSGGGILDILEVCESDFATNLAKEETEEADAQAEYEKVTQENAVTKTAKDQDVKYKKQESKSLDTTAAEYSADRETANGELSAVLDYYAKIKDRCIAKPETYAERKERREAEIEGLKQALSILEDETAFVQKRKQAKGSFRGTLSAQ